VGPTLIDRYKGRIKEKCPKIKEKCLRYTLIARRERFQSNMEDVVFKTSILIQPDK
jgi:hypothetical protein